ncbi:hypothetical protein TNCV_1536591 [Trichonephila clavipes]|nr:hypothetical protein TNCV_1536591 [Trichonephila clavipes]
MSSNTRCSGLSRQRGFQRLVWPARSPDLNPIENVWDALGRQVAGRNYPPTNKNTLIPALTEEWDKLPQQLLDNVVQMKQHEGFCGDGPRSFELWSSDEDDICVAPPFPNYHITPLEGLRASTNLICISSTRRVFSTIRFPTRYSIMLTMGSRP